MRRMIIGIAVFGSLSLLACGGGGGGNDGGTSTDGGNSNPLACGSDTTTVTAQQLFDGVINKAANPGDGYCTSCHVTGAPVGTGGGVVMDSVATLKANAGLTTKSYGTSLKIVDPNHPENSTMFLKCSGGSQAGIKGPKGESVAGSMPQGFAPLSAANLKMMKDWICSGAQ